jgi:DNA-binding response OmpR family regulator
MSETGRLLIVEDDVLVRAPLAAFLRECGYQVAEAMTPAEAQVLVDAKELPVDIVLARGERGFELAGWLRSQHPEVQVILAGSLERATEKAADLCQEGPAETLPYEHKFLLERIKMLLAGRDRATGG